jgi:uncharacterized membrane protein YcfT
METTHPTVARARTTLLATFSLAALLNLAEALWDPDGWLWHVLRIVVSVLFTVALVGFIVLRFRQRRSEVAD